MAFAALFGVIMAFAAAQRHDHETVGAAPDGLVNAPAR